MTYSKAVTSKLEKSLPSIFFLPGSLCDERLFKPQLNHFAKQYQLTVADFTGLDSVESMAQLVLKQAPGKFSLVGLSMGAIVALHIMKLAPNRVECLALLNVNPDAAKRAQIDARELQICEALNHGQRMLDELATSLCTDFVSSKNRVNTALSGTITQMLKEAGVDALAEQWKALNTRTELISALDSITCPTLIIGGMDDRICSPALHKETAAKIPNSRLKILPDCGHLSTLEAPHDVNLALQCLFQEIAMPLPKEESPTNEIAAQ